MERIGLARVIVCAHPGGRVTDWNKPPRTDPPTGANVPLLSLTWQGVGALQGSWFGAGTTRPMEIQ